MGLQLLKSVRQEEKKIDKEVHITLGIVNEWQRKENTHFA